MNVDREEEEAYLRLTFAVKVATVVRDTSTRVAADGVTPPCGFSEIMGTVARPLNGGVFSLGRARTSARSFAAAPPPSLPCARSIVWQRRRLAVDVRREREEKRKEEEGELGRTCSARRH